MKYLAAFILTLMIIVLGFLNFQLMVWLGDNGYEWIMFMYSGLAAFYFLFRLSLWILKSAEK